ncbi:MAG: glycosyltransferase family 4 protein [Flavobacteriales bacterium]
MKIVINTRLMLRGKLDGIGWFTHEIFSRMVRMHPEHEFHFIFDRPYAPEYVFAPNVHAHILPPQARHPLLFRIWYNWMIPRKLRQIGADVFVSPDMMLSLRTECKQIVVLHDLNFEHYPGDLPAHITRYLRTHTPLFARKASKVVTVSEFSKADIVKQYAIDSNKIEVVHNAAQSAYRVLNEEERTATRVRYTHGEPYFVFISSIHPRKNLQRLLQAYEHFRERTGSNVKLVAVGRRFWKNELLDETLRSMRFANDVIFTGHLEQEELSSVLGAAMCLMYVSYFEGFGVPIVEAFQSGVPVITSNVSSMPEVAGCSALLVDPFNSAAISDAMVRMYQDEKLRVSCIEQGLNRARDFSWEVSSERFWNVIQQTIQSS